METKLYHIIKEFDNSKKENIEKLIDLKILTIKHNRITFIENLIWDKESNKLSTKPKAIDCKFEVIKLSKGDLPKRNFNLTHKLKSELISIHLNPDTTYYLRLKPRQSLLINLIKFVNNDIKFIKIISFITFIASIATLIMFAKDCSKTTPMQNEDHNQQQIQHL